MSKEFDLSERAGVDFVGYYSCTTRQRRALHQLSRQVTEPAVDWELFRRLKDHYPELDPGKDNRSVTDPQWVARGLAKFGCPVHGSRSIPEQRTAGSQGAFPGASGRGFCSCGSKLKRQRDQFGSRRNSASGTAYAGGASAGAAAVSTPVDQDGGAAFPDLASGDRGVKVRANVGSWDEESYRHALRATFSTVVYSTGRVKPLSMAEVVENYVHMDHYSGAPYFGRNRDALEQAVQHASAIERGDRQFDPYVALRRVQFGDGKPKTRLVWGAPLATTLLATRFSKVLHRKLERRRPFAWGMDGFERGAAQSEIKSKFKVTYCLDFSGFDSSLAARIIRDCFNMLRQFLELDEAEENLWELLIHDFIHSRLLDHDRKVYRVHKGVPSGSAFTSQIGSLANLLILNYVFIRITGRALRRGDAWILGDDAIIGSDRDISTSTLASAAGELGITINSEKSVVVRSTRSGGLESEPDVHFLGKDWRNAQPHRSELSIVKRMVFPERHAKRSRSMSYIRFLSYAADACEWFDVARKIFPAPSWAEMTWKIMSEIDRTDAVVDIRDLPGFQRYLALVEENADVYQHQRKGMAPVARGRLA